MRPQFLLAILLLNLAVQLSNRSFREEFGWWALVIPIGLGAVAVTSVLVFGRLNKLPAVIDFDTGELRLGSQSTPLEEVDEAAIIHVALKRRDDLFLWFGGHKRRHATVALRTRRDSLSESDRAVLAAMVERSGIRLPTPKPDPYDPKGKFAWLDQQGFATKEQVLEALLHTPETGDVPRR